MKNINFAGKSQRALTKACNQYSDPSLYRASPIAASLLRGIFYSAFFTVNPDWLRGFTVV